MRLQEPRAKKAAVGIIRGLRLGHARQNTGSFASQHLVAVVVAAVSESLHRFGAKSRLGLLGHAQELAAVIDGIGDFVSDDEVVLDFNGALNVVADGSRGLAGSLHRARVGIGERDLRVFLLCEPRLDGFHALDFLFEPADFVFEMRAFEFRGLRLAVSDFKLRQVALDACLDLFQPLGHLGLREVPVARVDRFELAAVDGDSRGGEQARASAHHNELPAHFADGRAVMFAEIGDGLEVWREAARQPHRLDIALAFPLETAARRDAVEIAVDINLQHHRGVVGRPSGLFGIDGAKTKLAEIKLIHEKVDHPNRIVLGYIVFQLSRKHRCLTTIRPAYETAHPIPRILAGRF